MFLFHDIDIEVQPAAYANAQYAGQVLAYEQGDMIVATSVQGQIYRFKKYQVYLMAGLLV